MKRFIPATIFGIAFGFLESIVVIYLRKIYYPNGFNFPLTFLEPQMIMIEIIREFATIVMLVTIGWISGRKFGERFSFFIFTFGIWDIFYYVGLKVFLNWPESLLSWDVLFLIPITWIGPVLAPVICSIGMIIISNVYIYLIEKSYSIRFSFAQIILIIFGVLIIIYTFIYDYVAIITENNLWKDFDKLLENEKFLSVIQSYVPHEFNWILFALGCVSIGLSYSISFLNAIRKK